jgi:hypothetical protein
MTNSQYYTAIKEGYTMAVQTGTVYPLWAIEKDGVIIDHAMNHSPTKCELSAKIQAERVLNEILKQKATIKK